MKLKGKTIRICFVLFCFVLFSGSAILGKDKTFEEYKDEIIHLGKEKKFDDVLTLLEKVKAQFPEERYFQASIYYNIAYGYYVNGELIQVLSILNGISEQYSFYDPICALYARALVKNGEKNKALALLKRYPSNQDSFLNDLHKRKLDIWTTYNLAGAYALLNNSDLALLYLSTLFSVEGFDPKSNFLNVEKDSDFNLLRSDRRYVHLKDLTFAETFEDALDKIQSELTTVQNAVQDFRQDKSLQSETLDYLYKSKKNIFEIYTVAPNLIDIQRKIIDYIGKLEGRASDKNQLSWEELRESYKVISNSIEAARASQNREPEPQNRNTEPQRTGRRPRGEVRGRLN